MEYVILRRRNTGSHQGQSDVAVGATGQAIDVVHHPDLSPTDVRDLSRDKDVLGGAQPMPMSLIEPVCTAPQTAPTEENSGEVPTWGIRAVNAAECGLTGKGVRIAVLDTGIDKSHAAFDGIQFVGRNFTPKSETDPAIDPEAFEDTHGHGTHCAGTIFGRNVAGHRIGIARGVTDVLIGKVLGPGGGSTFQLYAAMNWAIENGAHIISMSLGMDQVKYREALIASGVHQSEATSTAMRVLIENVRLFDKFGNLLRSMSPFGKGVVVIAASGNGSDRDGSRFGDKPFTLESVYPAETEDFLSVGAINESGAHAAFSNRRTKFIAPGVDILSAAVGPDHKALRLSSGTSMATPHVAGVAALWAQKLMLTGAATAQRICDKLRESAVLPPGTDAIDAGYGIAQAPRV